MCEIRQEDHGLIEPGMRVMIAPELKGSELYGAEDPQELAEWCGKEVTVYEVENILGMWMVRIVEDESAQFYMAEIECIVEDAEILESPEPLSIIIGGVMQ